jgi:hypothetical protein
MLKAANFDPAMWRFESSHQSTETGSNPICPATQSSLRVAISGCARTADIPAGSGVRPTLWPAIAWSSALDRSRFRRGSLLAIFLFPFGVPETGPISVTSQSSAWRRRTRQPAARQLFGAQETPTLAARLQGLAEPDAVLPRDGRPFPCSRFRAWTLLFETGDRIAHRRRSPCWATANPR